LEERGFKVEILPSYNLVRLSKDYRIGRSSQFRAMISFGGTKLDKRNDPIGRGSLYFNELKDFDKMVVVKKMPGGTPTIL
jgi:hypothetical protein